MIREATDFDIPAIVGLVKDLHAVTRMSLPIEEHSVRRTLMSLIASPNGLLLVSGQQPEAFIAASVGASTLSDTPIAMEHGWWAGPDARGAGLRLLILYERWAKEQGCRLIRMSTPPHNDRAASILKRRGFFLSELAWGKVL